MLKLLINGINGQMGKAMLRTAPKWSDAAEIVCGVDADTAPCGCPVYANCEEIRTDFDVAVDFSVPKATMSILNYCVKNRKPIVICTTGLNEEQVAAIDTASKEIPVFRSGNMSVGINLLRALARQAKLTLGDGFDVEIVEMHHNRKVDAPSGTAKMLADSIASASKEEPEYVYGRHDRNRRRAANEIGIHSIRGGTIVGDHEVLFLGEDEAITLKHQAFSKTVFATGAFQAALFLAEKTPGKYDMNDLVGELL